MGVGKFPSVDIGSIAGEPTKTGLYPVILASGRALDPASGVGGAKLLFPNEFIFSKLNIGDRVIVLSPPADGQFYIVGRVPAIIGKTSDSLGAESLQPGEPNKISVRSQKTGGGFEIDDGGVCHLEANEFSRIFCIPGMDMLKLIGRRHHIGASGGELFFHQDDLTGRTAMLLQGRSLNKGELTSQIQLGYHEDITTVASLTIYPNTPEVSPQSFLKTTSKNPEWGGLWNGKVRKDFFIKISFDAKGTMTYQGGVPAGATTVPNITTTIDALGNVKLLSLKGDVLLNTLSMHLTMIKDISVICNILSIKAQSIDMVAADEVSIKSPVISALGNEVFLGVLDDAIPLCNENFFQWALLDLFTFLKTHTHAGVQTGSGISGLPVTPLIEPDETMITKNVQAS